MLNQLIERFQRLALGIKLVLLLGITCLAGWYGWEESVVPAQAELETATTEGTQLAQELENLSRSGQSLTAIEATRRKTEEEFHALFELLPKDVDIDRLLASFAEAARESGVSIHKFTPQRPGGEGGATPLNATLPTSNMAGSGSFGLDNLQRFGIAVGLEGTYAQISIFFDRILSLPRVVRLESFRLETVPTTAVAAAPRPGAPLFGAPAALAPGSTTGSSKLALKTTLDGSPILKCEAQFTTFTQKGELPALATLSAPTQAQYGNGRPPEIDSAPQVSADGTTSIENPPTDNPPDGQGMSAKPLETPSEGGK